MNSAHIVQISEMDLFRTLSEEELERITKVSVTKKFLKDQYIYKSGASIEYVYVALIGKVMLGKDTCADKTMIKDLVYDNHIFGENVFTEVNSRSEFARAMMKTQVLCIPINVFQQIFITNHKFAYEITKVIIERLESIENRIQNFVFLKAKQRIAGFIKTTAELKGIKIGIDEILINHGMSHKEIAFVTDTSRQTVARVLGDLKRENLIHFSDRKPNKILIRNIAKLA